MAAVPKPFLAVLALMLCASVLAAETVKVEFIEVLSGSFALAGEGSLKQLRPRSDARASGSIGTRLSSVAGQCR